MKGVILKFYEGSPFHEDTVFITCSSWSEFEEKLEAQFDSDINYMQIDSLDAGNHRYDAELRVGNYYYKCDNEVVRQVI